MAGPSGGANWELSDAHLLAIAEKVALKLLAARETEEPVEKEGERSVGSDDFQLASRDTNS